MRGRATTILTAVLAITLLVSVSGAAYLATSASTQTSPFTEFYVLGPSGNASDYPTNVTTSEEIMVIAGIANHEHEQTSYRLAVAWEQDVVREREMTLAADETRELDVTVTAPDEPGEYDLRFLLYRTGTSTTEPYRSLRLHVTVRSDSG